MELQQQEKLELWKERIQDCKNSGLTIIDWCERHGFSKHTYYYWSGRVKMSEQENDGTGPVFVEVSPPAVDPEQEYKTESAPILEEQTALTIAYNDIQISCGTVQEAWLAAEFIGRLQTLCSKPL